MEVGSSIAGPTPQSQRPPIHRAWSLGENHSIKLITNDGIECVGEVFGLPFHPKVVTHMTEGVVARHVIESCTRRPLNAVKQHTLEAAETRGTR